MCGFVLVLKREGGTSELSSTVARMAAAIRHRGPDDEGSCFHGPVGMGFRRLSILDTSAAGHQPMLSPDGQIALVFNGEIYNYIELRRELQALGHTFRSSGDTEVLMHAYLEWGTRCLDRFNGMWAFIIHDRRTHTLFGSRDRFGIKPLYRHRARDHLVFASEIKAIRASGLYRDAIHWPVAARHLIEGRLDDTPETFYRDIEQVEPGTAFVIDEAGEGRQWRYWHVEETGPVPADPAGEFRDLFEDAVRLHSRSDVPLAIHLSGGLDSTSIVCACARLRDADGAHEPLMAFSYTAPEFDESRYIADTVEQTAATLVTLASSPTRLWDLLSEVLSFQDEPMHSMTPLVGYELMRLSASHGIRVVLNGQGADETIAGYGSYFADHWGSLLRHGKVGRAWGEIGDYARAHGRHGAALFLGQCTRAGRWMLGRTRPYRELARWRRRRLQRDHAWFSEDLTRLAPEEAAAPSLELNARLIDSIYRDPLPLYLRIEDRNSMAHSIEARLPFLDYRLVSLLFRMPPEWRLRGPWNKYVLREAMRGRIPESVRTRIDKMGFPVPARGWFSHALAGPLLDVVTRQAARERGIYKIDRIASDIERHRRGEIDVTAQLFAVAQYEAWCALQAGGAAGGAGEATPRTPRSQYARSTSVGQHSVEAP